MSPFYKEIIGSFCPPCSQWKESGKRAISIDNRECVLLEEKKTPAEGSVQLGIPSNGKGRKDAS